MKRNEQRTRSRKMTNKIINGLWGLVKYEIKDKFCKICGDKKNIEVHHEVYPKRAWNIRKAIKEGKIYYLCKKCHKSEHNKLKSKELKK